MLYVHVNRGTDWWILGVKREKLSSSPTVASVKSQHCPTVGLCSLNTFVLRVYNDCIGRWRWRRERKMAKAIVPALSALLAATSISGELHEIYLLSWQRWTIPDSVFKHWKAGGMPQVSLGATKKKFWLVPLQIFLFTLKNMTKNVSLATNWRPTSNISNSVISFWNNYSWNKTEIWEFEAHNLFPYT